jgi:putative two-component system response regulator
MSRAASQQERRLGRTGQPLRRGVSGPWSEEPRAAGSSAELERALELASLIESASDAVVGVSPSGLLTSWSEGAERLFGYAHAEITGQSVLVLSPAGGREEARTLLEGVQAGERVERVQTERVAKDGRLLTVQISVSPIWDHDGEFAGAVGIYRDLSSQRRAEEELRASERRYHSVVEALSEGVVMRDVHGRVRASNKSAEHLLGLSSEQFTQSTSLPPLIHEDGSPFLEDEYPAIVSMRTGEPQMGIIMGVERPGDRVRWLSVNSSALLNPDEERPYAAVVSFTDITELRSTLEELQAARLEDLRRLALMGEYRDDDTNQHTERVAHTAQLLAVKLGVDGELAATIRTAAALHDVGKIGIPDRILLKPGKLTTDEFEVIKTHTTIGGRILGGSRFPMVARASEIALTHHERWDGRGYPARLKAEAIPIAGRITAVADAFDAMTHGRPYKSAYSVAHAVAELKRCRGSQFDPRVVDAFMTLDHHALVQAT